MTAELRVLIVDDEHLARERLTRMVDALAGYAVVGEASNGVEAIRAVQAHEPDVVLLDVRMPGMDGMETARHMTGLEQPPAVIFCTAYEEHALDAFDVQAVGYLLKPVRKENLGAALERGARVNKAQIRALNGTASERRTHISVRTHKGIELIPVDSIRYFQADHKYVTLRHADGELVIDETLKDLENEFMDGFVRIHRNALVAVRHIEGLDRAGEGHFSVRLRGLDGSLEISRRHLSAVRRLVKAL